MNRALRTTTRTIPTCNGFERTFQEKFVFRRIKTVKPNGSNRYNCNEENAFIFFYFNENLIQGLLQK